MKKFLSMGIVLGLLMGMLSGCGNNQEVQTGEAENGAAVINVGYVTSSYPLSYEDEDGNLTGYELEVLKLVDEQLDDYVFKYSSAAQDALYTGLSTGMYDLIVTNSFYTKERAEKYILPENPLGASLVGIVTDIDRTDIQGFEDAAKAGLSLAPILAGDGLYYVVDQYNEGHPEQTIALEATDSSDAFMNSISWVAEGRYDFAVWPKNYWEQVVAAQDGSLHQYYDKVQFIECKSVYTYSVIAAGEDEFAAAVSEALGNLYDDGTLKRLSEQFYGYDAFAYDNE